MTNKEQIIQYLTDNMELTEDLTKTYINKILDTIKTFDNKQQDYGPKNIADTVNEFGLHSIQIRIRDKEARIKNLLNKEKEPTNEPLADAFMDAAVYFIIMGMVEANKWPGINIEKSRW